MLVRQMGFIMRVKGKGSLDIAGFANALAAVQIDPTELPEDRRLLFVDTHTHADYHVGLVVTVKDNRTFCQLVRSGGSLLVKVNEMDHGTNLMDFNFFVINKKTGAGLYQHYHQSCSLNSFGFLAKEKFQDYRQSVKDSQLKALGASPTPTAVKKVELANQNRLDFEAIVRKEALADIIEELKKVKSFEYHLSTAEPVTGAFTPAQPYIRRTSHRISFSSGAPVSVLAKAVGAFAKESDIKAGRVVGEDQDGVERIIRIFDNLSNFGEYEFDELAPTLNALDLTKFAACSIVSELVKKCKEKKAFFELPEKT
jgi:hypothetical protein